MKIEGHNMPNFLKPYQQEAPQSKQILSAHNKRQLRLFRSKLKQTTLILSIFFLFLISGGLSLEYLE